jgi:anion-transporting  ArsA/GET3 family ATPase
MSLQSSGLANRRLVFVTGKGGTGKTTVASALAIGFAERGQRVLLAELGRDAQAPRMLAASPPAVGPEPVRLRDGLYGIRIDPFSALAEYLELQGWTGTWLARALRQRGLHDLLVGTPGWRELITLGKLWYMSGGDAPDDPTRREFDRIIVDAPATGHGLTLLDVPRVVHAAVRSGPLARNAARVEAMLLDPRQTVLLPVCWPETLPVHETVELVDRIEQSVGIHVDRVVVNGVATPSPVDPWPDLAERLSRLESVPDGAPPPDVMAACVRWARTRSTSQRAALDELEQRLHKAHVTLPHWPDQAGPGDAPDLERLRAFASRLLSSSDEEDAS